MVACRLSAKQYRAAMRACIDSSKRAAQLVQQAATARSVRLFTAPNSPEGMLVALANSLYSTATSRPSPAAAAAASQSEARTPDAALHSTATTRSSPAAARHSPAGVHRAQPGTALSERPCTAAALHSPAASASEASQGQTLRPNTAQAAAGMKGAGVPQKLAALFEKWDSDGSGFLDGPELCEAMRCMNRFIHGDGIHSRERLGHTETRFLLAFFFLNDQNGCASTVTLRIDLEPFSCIL